MIYPHNKNVNRDILWCACTVWVNVSSPSSFPPLSPSLALCPFVSVIHIVFSEASNKCIKWNYIVQTCKKTPTNYNNNKGAKQQDRIGDLCDFIYICHKFYAYCDESLSACSSCAFECDKRVASFCWHQYSIWFVVKQIPNNKTQMLLTLQHTHARTRIVCHGSMTAMEIFYTHISFCLLCIWFHFWFLICYWSKMTKSKEREGEREMFTVIHNNR